MRILAVEGGQGSTETEFGGLILVAQNTANQIAGEGFGSTGTGNRLDDGRSAGQEWQHVALPGFERGSGGIDGWRVSATRLRLGWPNEPSRLEWAKSMRAERVGLIVGSG